MPWRRIGTSAILAAAAFTLANGAWLAHWLGDQAKQAQISTLLSALHLGAQNLNPDQIDQIKGLPEEITGDTFTSLRSKLIQIRDALPGTRFCYLLGMRKQQLVFLVDAEDPARKDTFSPPGLPVKEQPEKWQPALDGRSLFLGPYHDEWGVWFTAVVPIFDQNQNVASLLDIDYPPPGG